VSRDPTRSDAGCELFQDNHRDEEDSAMRRMMMIATLTAVAMLATGTYCVAEDQTDDPGIEVYINMLRSELRAQKKALLETEMQFTDEEAMAFWPEYAKYEVEAKKWGDEWIKLAKSYYQVHANLSDEVADDMMEKSLKLQTDRIKLREKYFKRFAKVIRPSRAAQFMQHEAHLNLLIDLQIAAEMPLITPAKVK
jgi:hypothetical protein